ncbi:MAG TPA: hypothetical protein PKD20_04945 [Candidatus Saccharibacteria bacterium]|nr:hypothetical protein [Candidatus Saccharibacteria bacterium]HMT56190.1 hypothetical protein [Candidatus Saccharibacteria bacterium]
MIVNKKVSSFVHTKSTKFATRGGAEAARAGIIFDRLGRIYAEPTKSSR